MSKRSLEKVVIRYQTAYIDVINTRYQKFGRTSRGWVQKKKKLMTVTVTVELYDYTPCTLRIGQLDCARSMP